MSSFSRLHATEPPLVRARRDLDKLKRRLEEMNSRFPATRRFLAVKGVESVSQLDRRDMQELRQYLEGLYKGMLH